MTKGEVENNSVEAGAIQIKLQANEPVPRAVSAPYRSAVSRLIPPLIRLDKGRAGGELCFCSAKSERKISFSIVFAAHLKSLPGTSLWALLLWIASIRARHSLRRRGVQDFKHIWLRVQHRTLWVQHHGSSFSERVQVKSRWRNQSALSGPTSIASLWIFFRLSTGDVATPNDRSPNAISQFPTTVGSTVGQHTQPQYGHWNCMWRPKTAVC